MSYHEPCTGLDTSHTLFVVYTMPDDTYYPFFIKVRKHIVYHKSGTGKSEMKVDICPVPT